MRPLEARQLLRPAPESCRHNNAASRQRVASGADPTHPQTTDGTKGRKCSSSRLCSVAVPVRMIRRCGTLGEISKVFGSLRMRNLLENLERVLRAGQPV